MSGGGGGWGKKWGDTSVALQGSEFGDPLNCQPKSLRCTHSRLHVIDSDRPVPDDSGFIY